MGEKSRKFVITEIKYINIIDKTGRIICRMDDIVPVDEAVIPTEELSSD